MNGLVRSKILQEKCTSKSVEQERRNEFESFTNSIHMVSDNVESNHRSDTNNKHVVKNVPFPLCTLEINVFKRKSVDDCKHQDY